MSLSQNANASIPPSIHPQYADAFRCIGSTCEDTCCQSWTIPIDKSTYEKYQALPESPLRILIDQGVERKTGGSDATYAKVKLNADGMCPFLDEERLCAIQKKHGEDFLSQTCARYPRYSQTIDGVEERTLLLSCPEAARLVLLHPQLVQKSAGTSGETHYRDFLAQELIQPSNTTTMLAYAAPVRHFIVLLLQDRSYPLWQRVFLLHMFCKRLETVTARQEWSHIPILLREHAEMIATGTLRAALKTIPAQTTVQLGIVLTLIDAHDPSLHTSRRFAECIVDFAHGVGYRAGCTAADLTPNYLNAYHFYYRPWAAKHESILENYLLNYVFAHLFPFGKAGPEQGLYPYRASQLLCFQYGWIKGLLIGMAGRHRSAFSADHAIKLIQSFSRAVEHNSSLLKRIEGFCTSHSLNSTNGIAALLHDELWEEPAQTPAAATQQPISPL